jgi:2-polyprenyl-6-methoxyphenol hydroxylase-like FAD-dependent oxidoreductase
MHFSAHPHSTPVLIAGAGPVGLMLAIELRLGGIDVLVVEQRPTGTVGQSRAVGVNARSLEFLIQRGVGERALELGAPMPAVLFAGIFMDPGAHDDDWPGALRLPQHQTERLLTERALELGAHFAWSTTVVGLRQDDDGVTVDLESDGETTHLRAAYLAACDGGRSTVRTLCEIPFPGVRGEDWWIVGDVDLASPPEGRASFGRNDLVGFYQVSRAEADVHRVTLKCLAPPRDPAAPVTLEEARAAMIEGLGTDYGLRDARWLSRWSDGFRQAERYRSGRVFLAGDAAHTHPPIGGQGLNVGLQDAVNLGWKLAAVLRGDAPDDLLDSYHDERHAAEVDATRWSLAQTELIKPGPRRDAQREVIADLLTIPAVTLRMSGHLSGLSLRYPLDGNHPIVGYRMPDLVLAGAGTRSSVFDALRLAKPALVDLTGGALPHTVSTTTAPWDDRLVRITGAYDPDLRGDGWHFPAIGDVPAFDAALLRPDGHVVWANPAGGGGGPPPPPPATASSPRAL